MDTDKTVLMCSVLTMGSTLANSMLPTDMGGKGELPSARLLIGSSLAFMGLSILGAGAPKLATGLSISMATTALMYYGIPLADHWFNPDATKADGKTPRTPRTITVNINGKDKTNEG
jgi:hypothetical protein